MWPGEVERDTLMHGNVGGSQYLRSQPRTDVTAPKVVDLPGHYIKFGLIRGISPYHTWKGNTVREVSKIIYALLKNWKNRPSDFSHYPVRLNRITEEKVGVGGNIAYTH